MQPQDAKPQLQDAGQNSKLYQPQEPQIHQPKDKESQVYRPQNTGQDSKVHSPQDEEPPEYQLQDAEPEDSQKQLHRVFDITKTINLTDETVIFPRSFTIQKPHFFGFNANIVDPEGKTVLYGTVCRRWRLRAIFTLHRDGDGEHISFTGGNPDLALRTTPDKTSPILAAASLPRFSSSVKLAIIGGPILRVHRSGFFHWVYSFHFTLPNGQTEDFKWKRSAGAEVKSIHEASHGLKLVRVSTGEVIAAVAGIRFTLHKWGKFSFIGNEMLGPRFELMAVMTLMAFLEQEHRQTQRRRSAIMMAANMAVVPPAPILL